MLSQAKLEIDHSLEVPDSLHDLLRRRWSPRSFSDRNVSPELLRPLLEAAQWASSSFNEQPWRFIIATKDDPAGYDRLLSLLLPMNQAWAKQAPILLLSLAKQTFSHNGAPNYYGLHDAGQALSQMMLQATAFGLHGHAMGGFDRAKARELLNIPDDFAIGAMVALGYAASPDQLDEELKKREAVPRTRKPVGEIAFQGLWNAPLSF